MNGMSAITARSTTALGRAMLGIACAALGIACAASRAATGVDGSAGPQPSDVSRPDAGWTSAWATALQPMPERPDLPALYRAPDVAGRTVRQIVHPSLDGRSARLYFSNRYGRTPLELGEVRIARAVDAAQGSAGVGTAVMFGGRASVLLPPGAEIASDPVPIAIARGAPYAVSIYLPAQRMSAWHRVASQVNRVSSPGNHTADTSGAAFAGRFTQSAWLTTLAVDEPGSGTVAAIGDSITDGMGSSLNRNQRWPDALARRLAQSGAAQTGVINLGISGNRLLSDSPCYGEALDKRFAHDVLARPGVKSAIVLIGINDINFQAMPPRPGLDCDYPHTAVTPDQLVAGLRQLVASAHRAGIRIHLATITPAALPPPREAQRQAVNQWIRSGGGADGVIDFDAALRDPDAPTRLLPRYDSGDHIHPGDAGYAAMAAAVPLDSLRSDTHP